MTADGVVEAIDVAADGSRGVGACLEGGAPDEFGFQRLEECLDHGVVEAVSPPGHGDQDAKGLKLGLVVRATLLTSEVRVVDQACRWAAHHNRFPQRRQGQITVQPITGRPADHTASEQVDDDGEV